MAQQFNLTAQINLQSPKNVGKVVSDIQRQLKGSGLNTVNIKVKADPRSMAQTNRQLQNVGKNSRAAAKDINSLNRSLQEATRRFSVITLATGSLLSFVSGFKNATKAAIEFERELIKISQVTGKSLQQLQGLTKEVTRLSTAFGVSSADLLNVSRTLAQAGFNAEKTRKSLDILAKTTLAATFDNIQDTTEGAIALLRQFGNEAKRTGGDVAFLEKSLDAINSVSKKFAVESGDLITVIRRVGGVFSSAGGSVNELIALFTSVRATTRESAETIATGLRTIFTRIQRVETINQLKALNIQLQDSQGQFVGAFEAVKRLSQGLSALNPRDFRFNQIVEQLGGFRQIGKVIPLIQQFDTAQRALTVAQASSGSTAKDAATAQQGLGVQIQKVREEFTALIRKFTDSGPFNTIATGALKIASAMIKVAEAVEPLLPLLTTMFGLKLGKALAPGVASLAGVARSGGRTGGGGFSRFARGGMVPGSGNRDTVPAMLTPGEFVIKKSSVKKMGSGTLAQMNQNGYAAGGIVTSGRSTYGSQQLGRAELARGLGINRNDSRYELLGKRGADGDEARRVANQELAAKKSGAKGPASKAGPGGRKIGSANLTTPFGVSFLRQGAANMETTIRNLRKVSNKTGKKAFDQAILSSVQRQEKGLSQKDKTKTADQAVARYVGTGARVKASRASVTYLQKSGKKIFDDEIMNGVPQLFERATSKFRGTELQTAAIPLNRLLSTSAIGSIEGQFFEAFVRNITKNVMSDSKTDAIFDFTAGRAGPTQTRADLNKLFGPGNFELPNEFKNRAGEEQIASAIGKGLSLGTAGNLRFQYLNKGGGISGSDTVPAMLTPGEFVFNKGAAQSIGYGNLNRMNKQGVQGFADGGAVGVQNFQEGGGVRSGLQRVDRAATAAQSFIFLGGAVSAVTAQMSSLEDATKKAVNETVGFVAGFVGIGATLINTVTSLIGAQTAEIISSEKVSSSKQKEALSSDLNTKKMSKFGIGLTGLSLGIGIVLTAFTFMSAKLRAEADILAQGFRDALAKMRQTGEGNVATLQQSARQEIQNRNRAADLTLNPFGSRPGRAGANIAGGLAAGIPLAFAGAKAGAVAGAAGGPIGATGGALGGLVGGFALGALGLDALLPTTELSKVAEDNIKIINKSITGLNELYDATLTISRASKAIEEAPGLSSEEKITKSLDSITDTSALSNIQSANNELAKLALAAGVAVQDLNKSNLEQLDDTGAALKSYETLQLQLAAATELVNRKLQITASALGEAISAQVGSTKSFDELLSDKGTFARAFEERKKAIEESNKIEIEGAKRRSRQANLAFADTTKTEQERKNAQEDLLAASRNETKVRADAQARVENFEKSTKNVVEAQRENVIQLREAREAQRALNAELKKTSEATAVFKERTRLAREEEAAIGRFIDVINNKTVQAKALGVTEIDNITDIFDFERFAKEVRRTSAVGGGAAQEIGESLIANATLLQDAQEKLVKQDFEDKGKGFTVADVLEKELGLTANTTPGGKRVFDRIVDSLNESIRTGGNLSAQVILQAFAPLTEVIQGQADTIKGVTESEQAELNKRSRQLDAVDALRQKELDVRKGLVDATISGLDALNKANNILAKSINPDAQGGSVTGLQVAAQQAFAQRNLDTAGLGLQAGNVDQIVAARQKALIDLKNLDQNQVEARRDQERIIRATTTELERLADGSSEINAVTEAMDRNLQAIEKERRAREQVTGVIEDFVVGGVEVRRGLVEAASGVRQAFATGTLQLQTPEQRSSTVGLLDRLSDVQLAGGMTGRQIKQELVFRDAIRLGLDPELAQAIATGTSTEEKLIEANKQLTLSILVLASRMQDAALGLALPDGFATGGMVQYRAGGGSIFKPKGTDTVPAMLTPGEFVIRKSAVDAIGADNLAAINDGASYFHYGGDVGKHKHPHLDRDVQDGRYARGLAPRSASEVLRDIKDQMTPLSPAPPPLRDRDPHIIDMINTPDEFSRDLSGIPFTHSDYGKTGGLQLEDPNAIHKQNLKASAKTTANIAKEFGSDFAGRSGSVFGAVGSELSDFVNSGTIGIMQSLGTDGFAEPQTGPFRSTKGTTVLAQLANDRQQLEDYSQTQQFIGKVAAEAIEGTGPSTLGSGLMRGLDELGDFIAGDRQGTSAAERQRIDRQYMGVGQPNEQRRFGGDVASPGGLGPSEAKLQRERDFESEIAAKDAIIAKKQSARERHKAYTAQAEKEGKLKLFFDDDGFPNYNFLGMNDAELRLIAEGKHYNTNEDHKAGDLRENPQGGTDFWLSGEAKNELYRRKHRDADKEREAYFKERAERDKALGIDKLDLTTAEGRAEKGRLLTEAARKAEAAAEQQKASAETSNPSDLPKAKAAEREAEKAVKDATKAQTEAKQQQQAASALASGAEPSNPSDLPKPDAQSKQPTKDKATAAQKAAKAGSEFNILWYRRNGYSDEIIAAKFPNSYEAQRLKGTSKPLPKGFDLSESPEPVPFSAEEQRIDADMKKQLEGSFVPEGVTTDDVRESLNKNQGQGGSSTGSFLSALGSSVFSNAKDFLSRMEGGDKFVGPLDTRSRRQKARDRRFGRRGIESRSQRGTPAQLARRQQEAGAELDPNNPINKARYERILRTQGPAAAQRFAKTSGYEPPDPRRRFTRGQRGSSSASNTDQLLQQLLQQMLRQGGGNRGGVMPRAVGRAAGGGVGGADVIPAMLTPGEFVMSAGAVRQHGVGAMRSLNRGQVPGFNRGGMVGGVAYRAFGSNNAETVGSGAPSAFGINTEGLESFQQQFDSATKSLTSAITGLQEVGNFVFTHNFVVSGTLQIAGVNIDTTQIAQAFSQQFTKDVEAKIEQAFDNRNKNVQTPGQG